MPRARRLLGLLVGVVLPVAVTLVVQLVGSSVGLTVESLLFVAAIVVTAVVGGFWPALVAVLVGDLLLNYYFIAPVHTFRVEDGNSVASLVILLGVGALVSAVVHRATTMTAQADRAARESQTLSVLATSAVHGSDALPFLVDQARVAFGMTSAALLHQPATRAAAGPVDPAHPPSLGPHPSGWQTVHATGAEPPRVPGEADAQVAVSDGFVLALAGRRLPGSDRPVLDAFGAQAAALLERDRLSAQAAVAARLEATERLRDALLAAVGHDLRTPLAAATAAVSSLRSTDVSWSAEERGELLESADVSLHRLGRLVADVLDLSRLRAGALSIRVGPMWLDDVVSPALDELGEPARDVRVDLPDDLPPALGDAALVTRAVVNVLANALRFAPPGQPPSVTGRAGPSGVELRVVDRGPGVSVADRDRVFLPFQRLGDTDNTTGLGLGLALSRGLVEAMDGTLRIEDTPGGGLTMVLRLPPAPSPADPVVPVVTTGPSPADPVVPVVTTAPSPADPVVPVVTTAPSPADPVVPVVTIAPKTEAAGSSPTEPEGAP